MITLNTVPTGLSFTDWLDVLQNCGPDDTLGSFHFDQLPPWDTFFLSLMLEWRQHGPVTPEVANFRGIGNWKNPKVIIGTNQLCLGRGRELKERAHPYWFEIPSYRRIRPFGGSIKARKILYKFLNPFDPNSIYIIHNKQPWLHSDFPLVENQINIDDFIPNQFFTEWRGPEWKRNVEKFSTLVWGRINA